ncbi:MAG: transcriptional regulator CynR [Gordonia sp. (in: high G+C Gram-positive bacteria)]|uniref:transcriptional regulator CynR n=1 Tax=Gordonia sp. (in: high G+C Gram-positive bacteria) TaxID=84139 RepID=UPI003C76D2C3
MELRQIKYVLAVADHGNFTRAAESLHISQPTLSQQIKQFERALGVELLDRSGRTVTLTDAGRAYTHHARLALRDLDAAQRAVHDVQDLSRGHLRLSMTPTFTAYLIGPLLHEFRVRHPGVTVTIRETTQARIENDLVLDEIDLGIGLSDQHASGVEARPLFTESLTVVVGRRHPLARRHTPLPVAALEAEPLCLLSRDFSTRVQIDEHLAELGLTPRIAVEASSISALMEIVKHGDMATILPDAVTRAHPDLIPVPSEAPMPIRQVRLLRRSTAYHSVAARAFVSVLLDHVNRALLER